jgi:ATP-dependent Clp protease adaptor protein ClpS
MAREVARSDGPEFGAGLGLTTAPVRKPSEPVRKPRELPPYRVLLHNDDVNTVEHVVRSILHLTELSPEEAVARTLEAHETGVALLLVTHRERAELYQEQFTSLSLTVTIEPA